MIIGFDAKRAAQNKTGLGNYSRLVIDIVSTKTTDSKCLLYVPKNKKHILLPHKENTIEMRTPKSWFWRKLSSLWRVWGITSDIIKDKVDIFHGLSNELPLNIRKAKHTKSVVTIHDLIFIRHPEYYKFIDRKIYEYKFRKACINSDRIIAVSECTKRDIVDIFNIEPAKINVVYQGCDDAFKHEVSTEKKQEVKVKHSLPDKFLLYVGSIEERKNLLLAVKALPHLAEEINIIAVGKHTPYADKVLSYAKKHGVSHRLKMYHNIAFSELTSFYQLAHAFVYTSFYEGFGIPILEALCSRLPVIAATGSCLEEAGGKHSIYVNPNNEKEMAKAIDTVWNDNTARQKMIDEGLKYAAKFEDNVITNQMLSVYNQLIK